jgi:acetolactate synthase-1/2/3 large subunit
MAPSANDLNADHESCAAWIARFLKARGVDRIFGLQGTSSRSGTMPRS